MPERALLDLDLDPAEGTRLVGEAYREDFRRREAEIHGRDSWKLERRQYFHEASDPSRQALSRGEWAEALRLLEEEREDWLAVAREDASRGSTFRRVRIVSEPLTPYVQWELHALRIQAECGIPVRVVQVETVAFLEERGPLPEVVVLGGKTLYEVCYTDAGVSDGAVRFEDAEAIARWEGFIAGLYHKGEDVVAYTDRYVAHLPPPQGAE